MTDKLVQILARLNGYFEMVKRQGGEHYWTARVDNMWGGRRG